MRIKNSKARAATVLLAACLALAFGSCAQAETTHRLRVVVTHTAPPLVPNSVMDLAETLGFYRREGLAADLVRERTPPWHSRT